MYILKQTDLKFSLMLDGLIMDVQFMFLI